VDCPNTRDLQFLITDGETFCHEERRDLDHKTEYPEKNALFYRLTTTAPGGRYKIIKDVITDPHLSVFLMSIRFEIVDESLKSKLRAYALLAPHVKGLGQHNSARFSNVDGRKFFHVEREDIHMTFGAVPDFKRRSVGYVGFSDGWQDLMEDCKMSWEFERALDGNLALVGEVDLSKGNQILIGIGFGHSPQSSSTKLLQSLSFRFEEHRDQYVRQWKRTMPGGELDLRKHTGDGGGMYRLSRLILLAHEDKIYPGA
jgi:glucoamylase